MVNNSRRLGRIIAKSLMGEPLSLADETWLYWAAMEPEPEPRVIGNAWLWVRRAVVAYAVCAGVYFGLEPLIGGFAFLVALLVWLVLGAHWCRRG